MNKLKEKQIKIQTKEIWDSYFLNPGFDIKALIGSLGITYIEKKFKDKISGLLIIENNRKIICINSLENEVRKRFSAAHELGHYFLHKNNSLNIDRDQTVFLRDSNSKKGTYAQEIEANFFAANLLMPEDLIHENIEPELIIEDNVERLQKIFKVSQTAMANRLTSLGYI